MKYYTALSSETYNLDPRDVVVLKDTADNVPLIKGEDVVILLGDSRKKTNDTIYQGRSVIEHSIANNIDYIPVRIAFKTRVPYFNLITSFCKGIRKHFNGYGSNNYHIKTQEICDKELERNIRTEDTAYRFNRKSIWVVSKDQRSSWMEYMETSFKKNGYDDKFPMDVMLCRSFGVKDKLHQGHHRMMFCKKFNIERVSVRFVASSHAPNYLRSFFLFLIKITGYKTNSTLKLKGDNK